MTHPENKAVCGRLDANKEEGVEPVSLGDLESFLVP